MAICLKAVAILFATKSTNTAIWAQDLLCNKVEKYEPHVILCACYEVNGAYVEEKLRYNKGTCLSYEDMVKKSNGKPLYGLHISDLKIYDEPKALSCFYKQCPKNTTCSTCDWFHVD